jgi:outer membrane protein
MNHLTVSSLAVLALAVGLLPPAPRAGATSGECKIGVVDFDKVLANSPAGRRANIEFESRRKAKQGELDKQQEDLVRSNEVLNEQKSTLDPAEFEKQRQAIEKRFVALNETYVKLERELAEDRTRLIQDLLAQAKPALESIAKDDGFAIILESTAAAWHEPAVDVTERVSNALQ